MFTVEPEIFERFPGMRIVVVVAQGIDNREERPDVEARWRAAWEGASSALQFGNAQSHPRVKIWRQQMQAIGVSGKRFPTSIEALLRRAMKGGSAFSINPLVDFYNAVSLENVVPAGGYDLDAIDDRLELRVSRQGDRFQALDEDTLVPVAPGEPVYTSDQDVLTRYLVWKQSRRGLLQTTTRRVLLLSEILGEVSDEVVVEVQKSFESGLKELFQVAPTSVILDRDELSCSLGT